MVILLKHISVYDALFTTRLNVGHHVLILLKHISAYIALFITRLTESIMC